MKEIDGKLVCESKRLNLATSHDLKSLLTALADLGYEKAVLDEKLIQKVQRTSTKEIRTLQELIEEVKREKNSELCGGIGVFIGFVRKLSGGKEVVRLEYEAYEPVFSEKIAEIESRLKEYPGVEGVKIFHKTGVLEPGEDIIYVVIMGRHRKDLWKPLAESMEIVKKELPIWKKEVYADGEVWVHDK
ncbi:MAG: molybdenum cofactor biosynthesis protein MoaE [Archaeoglobus sp.]|nr:molybdenum cofactor biosynthesis protein MoaE [Archaeoglobus sp.]